MEKSEAIPGCCFYRLQRTRSLPTIYLKIPRMLYNRCARFVGRLKSFTPELKQLTGIESCQCRKARIQRNHIACAILVWSRLKDIAYKTGQTIYQIKYKLLSDY
jgi:hypothetical protein